MYLLKQMFDEATKQNEPDGTAQISGIGKFEREMIPYETEDGKRYFFDELVKNFTSNQSFEIVNNLIIPARIAETLKRPLFIKFTGSTIYGELKDPTFRILIYRIDENKYLMLNAFIKKTNGTPRSEIIKAKKRIAEYLSRDI